MKIPSESHALVFVDSHSDVPKILPYLFIREFWEIGLGKTNSYYNTLLIFVPPVRSKQ